jgi:hypothetical protein
MDDRVAQSYLGTSDRGSWATADSEPFMHRIHALNSPLRLMQKLGT